MKRNTQNERTGDRYPNLGKAEIERVMKIGNGLAHADWPIFETVEEAIDYFNSQREEFPDMPCEMPAWMIQAAAST
jgi:hypothetical protein